MIFIIKLIRGLCLLFAQTTDIFRALLCPKKSILYIQYSKMKHFESKTLLYLASGPIIPEYQDLPFGKMIFVDRCGDQGNVQDNRFEFIRADALIAVEQLLERNIKIDYLVSVNEGLWEGGGNYPVLSDFMLGYLSPILSDEFILVCCPEYYKALRMTLKPEWGFRKTILTETDPGFIYPSLFEFNQRRQNLLYNPDFGKVYKMTREKSIRLLQLNLNLDIKLIYGSIWDAAAELDLIGINLLSRQQIDTPGGGGTIDKFFKDKGVFDLNGRSIQEITAHVKAKGFKRLGLCPWMNHNYSHVIAYLRELEPGSIESIHFYHLHERDFKQLNHEV